jgi:phosphatidylethanolamine-binding protein (PEBP) family uncharacterized protein
MGVVGTLLKNRRAGEAKLAWNLANLSAPETLVLTSDAFADGEAIPAEHAGKRVGGKNLSAGVRVLRSGMGRGYLGPEPIKGHGPHRYTFQLFALAAAAAAHDGAAAEQARPRALLSAVSGPVLARGRLTGVYER